MIWRVGCEGDNNRVLSGIATVSFDTGVAVMVATKKQERIDSKMLLYRKSLWLAFEATHFATKSALVFLFLGVCQTLCTLFCH